MKISQLMLMAGIFTMPIPNVYYALQSNNATTTPLAVGANVETVNPCCQPEKLTGVCLQLQR